MRSDPIIDGIRKYREEYAARFDGEIEQRVADQKRRQKEIGWSAASRLPKRIARVSESSGNGDS